MKKEFFVDKLRVVITDTRDEMGAAAASDAAEYMRAQIAKLGGISAIFAAAPSQNEVLEHVSREDIDWSKVTAYHMDEREHAWRRCCQQGSGREILHESQASALRREQECTKNFS